MPIVSQMSNKNTNEISVSYRRRDRAVINKLVIIGQTDLFPLLILDERVSNRIYANQLNLFFSSLSLCLDIFLN